MSYFHPAGNKNVANVKTTVGIVRMSDFWKTTCSRGQKKIILYSYKVVKLTTLKLLLKAIILKVRHMFYFILVFELHQGGNLERVNIILGKFVWLFIWISVTYCNFSVVWNYPFRCCCNEHQIIPTHQLWLTGKQRTISSQPPHSPRCQHYFNLQFPLRLSIKCFYKSGWSQLHFCCIRGIGVQQGIIIPKGYFPLHIASI